MALASGAIACALAHNRPVWQITAIEQCANALYIAQKNAKKLGVDTQISFKQQNWLAAIQPNTFELIISNPPYIDPEDSDIDRQVAQHEPMQALFSPDQGLQDIQLLISQSYSCLKSGGLLVLEHGHRQQEAVIALLEQAHFATIQGHQDLSGHDRFICAQKPSLDIDS